MEAVVVVKMLHVEKQQALMLGLAKVVAVVALGLDLVLSARSSLLKKLER